MTKRIFLLVTTWLLGVTLFAQTADENTVRAKLSVYFDHYTFEDISQEKRCRLDSVLLSDSSVQVFVNATLASQTLSQDKVRDIYHDVQQLLPPPYNTRPLSIYAHGTLIDELMPAVWGDTLSAKRLWGNIDYHGNAWVTPLSLPYKVSRGLQGRHLSLWASHGRYYDLSNQVWKWQRPRLYCTCEDLFTQTLVVPFLMPMLQNAGAVVFTPRERDWQSHEAIVDNDDPKKDGQYLEVTGQYEWRDAGQGFANPQDIYYDKQNPFEMGTARCVDVTPQKRSASTATWYPEVPEDGDYAVYVSYVTLPTSVSDALYTVRHRGVNTRFRVNQQMGGGTWVYLGTFNFAAGQGKENCITLSNVSNYRGVVTADAVRVGGGMGNIARGDTARALVRSGLPRYLEGARYSAQWGGMPYPIYGTKESQNDYGEDINARSLMSNYLARGSVFVPRDSASQPGLQVPIELEMAIHSDAGSRRGEQIVGTLGIYTTGFYDGMYPSGLSRLTSRDLCDGMMTQVNQDLKYLCGDWTRREMRDENYSETREPRVPSMILETMSHQNWADMKRGHDPWFKFLFARSIYKGILHYVNHMHGVQNVVAQPMPVSHFSAMLNALSDSVCLSWQPELDPVDSTAVPTGYVVYESVGDEGFDNGTLVHTTSIMLPLHRGHLHRYKVCAVNEGGESLESEELCAYNGGPTAPKVLIVNGFQRLASPQPFDSDTERGFDMAQDPGVIYKKMPCYSGKQLYFNKDGFGKEGTFGLGNSGNELEGKLLVGNTFDFPTLHARDFLTSQTNISIASTSRAYAEEHNVCAFGYKMVDVIFGAQRKDGYSMLDAPLYSTPLCDALRTATLNGSSLLVSGAYLGKEVRTEGDSRFAEEVLHFTPAEQYALSDTTCTVQGMNTAISLYYQLNEEQYAIPSASTLLPSEGAFVQMTYLDTQTPAAVSYPGENYRVSVYGFPLECITDRDTRQAIMRANLDFLLK